MAGGLALYRVANYPTYPGAPQFLARLTAPLDAQTNLDGTACFWAGSGPDRMALTWPQGYLAHGSPLSIFDEKGQLLATSGKLIDPSGGMAPDDFVAKPILGCGGARKAWIIGTVIPSG